MLNESLFVEEIAKIYPLVACQKIVKGRKWSLLCYFNNEEDFRKHLVKVYTDGKGDWWSVRTFKENKKERKGIKGHIPTSQNKMNSEEKENVIEQQSQEPLKDHETERKDKGIEKANPIRIPGKKIIIHKKLE